MERHSHTLAPLTKITSKKVKYKWTKIKQDTFYLIKWVVSCNNLLTCPDFNESFKTHANSINFQLGAFIGHKENPFDFYGRKHAESIKIYTVTERELLRIIKTLK